MIVGLNQSNTNSRSSIHFNRKEKLIEVFVFLFLIVPSMVLSVFVIKPGALSFVLVSSATILRDLALVSLILFFLWHNKEHVIDIGWTLKNGWKEVGLGVGLFIPLFFGSSFLESALQAAGLSVPSTPLPALGGEKGVTEFPRIEYAGADGKMLTASQAQASGAIAGSKLQVEYENGTQVYVNRGVQGNWTVPDAAGQTVELPPSGWLVYNTKNNFREISASIAGRRIDYVNAPEFEFLDGRGEWTEMGRLGASGSVARRQRPGGEIELIDIYGNTRIGFQESGRGTVAAFDGGGKALGKVELRAPRAGWYEFTPLEQGRSYVFTPER